MLGLLSSMISLLLTDACLLLAIGLLVVLLVDCCVKPFGYLNLRTTTGLLVALSLNVVFGERTSCITYFVNF